MQISVYLMQTKFIPTSDNPKLKFEYKSNGSNNRRKSQHLEEFRFNETPIFFLDRIFSNLSSEFICPDLICKNENCVALAWLLALVNQSQFYETPFFLCVITHDDILMMNFTYMFLLKVDVILAWYDGCPMFNRPTCVD